MVSQSAEIRNALQTISLSRHGSRPLTMVTKFHFYATIAKKSPTQNTFSKLNHYL
jgi:hypothetical protein